MSLLRAAILRFSNEIRYPISLLANEKIKNSILLSVAGVMLGILSKALDEFPSNELPFFLEVLDLRNFFSRIGVWLFLRSCHFYF